MNPHSSNGQPQFLHDFLDLAYDKQPDAVAVRDAMRDWRVSDLSERSYEITQWLLEQGVRPGERVVVQAASDGELVALMCAVSRIGAIFVPLNPGMKPFQLSRVIKDVDPVVILGSESSLENLRSAVTMPVHDLTQLVPQSAGHLEVAVDDLKPTDIAVIVYTSGSTLLPKGVIEPHAQIVFATLTLVQSLGYRKGDVVFCRFPLSWDYGLYKVLMCLAANAQIVLADQGSDLQLIEAIAECQATVIPVVPSLASMILTLARHRTEPIAPVRLITNTGAALPDSVIVGLRKLFPGALVIRQFGQTECKRISVMPPDQDDQRPGAVGLPLAGTRVSIESVDGGELPPGEVGEIVVRGPHVMAGYWNNPEQTAHSFAVDPDGTRVLHTGDYGSMDEDGYLYFEGRRDDMFKRKGIRVSSLEIEAAALDVAGIHEAAVLPPTENGDMAIFVVADLTEHEVLRALAERLESAKVPATCLLLDQMPLTQHGKVSVEALRSLLTGAPA